jgi:CubicO group peptidase (beta-lactamase class C family)
MPLPNHPSRRAFLAATGTAMATTAGSLLSAPAGAATTSSPLTHPTAPDRLLSEGPSLVRELDAKIRADMATYAIPGVAVGLLWRGVPYVQGYGVTDIDNPVPVDGDTGFRVASTTKTFTGTAVMRLVERRLINLDAPVVRYLPDLRTADPSVARRVTVRQLLNHTAGWLGDYFLDTGEGRDAMARYVAGLVDVPQLTPPGEVFAYNNAALGVAGRLIEVVTGQPYETALHEEVLGPLGLAHSVVSTLPPAGLSVAASHDFLDGAAVSEPSYFRLWRSLHALGGLISSARDQLRWARFHLGDGTVPGSGSARLLTRDSVRAMRSHPGPGGTLFVELEGVGITWMLRPSAQGVRVVQHGGDWAGQHSGFLMVPERDFALTVLTNSETGPALLEDLFTGDWALQRFAGVSNLPANLHPLSRRKLADYEGTYTQEQIGPDGVLLTGQFDATADAGQLLASAQGVPLARVGFYRRDYGVVLGPDGELTLSRANFVRGPDGEVDWLRLGGRLSRRTPAGTTTPSPAAQDPAGPSRVRQAQQPAVDLLRPWRAALRK